MSADAYTDDPIVVIDPETRPYVALTPFRPIRDHRDYDTLPHVGDILEFRNRMYPGKVYRGVVTECAYTESYASDWILRVRVIHADTLCSGDSWADTNFRIVRSPGPRVREFGRGYTGKRPRGGATLYVRSEDT